MRPLKNLSTVSVLRPFTSFRMKLLTLSTISFIIFGYAFTCPFEHNELRAVIPTLRRGYPYDE
ncbi:MAG: hypothetical protein V1871_08755 [Planctomycetota bacterium]